MVQGSMSCVKYLMFVFNFVFVVCGVILIIIGAIVQKDDLTVFVDSKFVTGPTILIVVGCIIFLLAFLGCTGAVKENRCMVTTFGVLLFVIFIIEIAGGISAYVHKDGFADFLKENMNSSIAQEKKDANTVWDEMQSKWKCCGVDSPFDYPENNRTIPASCCPQPDPSGQCEPKTIYEKGCFDKMLETLKSKLSMVGGVAVGIAVIELVGCMFAWCLASAIRKEYEGV